MKRHMLWARASCAVAIAVIAISPLLAQNAAGIKTTIPISTQTPRIAPSPLLAVDQNRATVVDRIVAQWGEPLQRSGATLNAEQMRALLAGLRADHLLAASLAGTLDGLRDVIANALVATADVRANLLHTKALGDASDDLVYTPVVPCRLADTRVAGGAIAANATRDFKVWVSSGGFTAQGGDSGNCGVPADPAAVVLNIAVVNMVSFGNLIAYPTGGALPNTSVLNYQGGTFALSNGAIIPACVPGCANQLTVRTNGAGADVVMDIVGYFKPPGAPIGTVSNIATGTGLTGGPITTTGTIGLATTQLLPTSQCASNQVPQWNGSTWICATVTGGAGGGTVTSVGTGSGLSGGPITTSGTINLAATQLMPTSMCATNQIPKWSGSAWTCGADNNSGGTVTSVTAGAGLTGGTITTSGTVAVDPTSSTLTSNFFKQGGNAFGAPAVLASLGGQDLFLSVSNAGIWLHPFTTAADTDTVNIISGSHQNSLGGTVVGATIAGGGGVMNGTIVGNRVDGNYSTIGGGNSNKAIGFESTVAGGAGNTAQGVVSMIGGGNGNNATGGISTIGGGNGNNAPGGTSTIGGGNVNTASGEFATVGGGYGNTAGPGNRATVGGGYNNNASGLNATIPGGYNNVAVGQGSFAAGQNATASHVGSFVWGDGTQAANSTGNNTFSVLATGGIGLFPGGAPVSIGWGGGWSCTVNSGSSNWACSSDRNLKENFLALDARDVLRRVVDMPITSWTFVGHSDKPHIGPVAQDFHAAFGLGDANDNTHIDIGDSQGVALAAIQGLNAKVEAQASTISEHYREIADLRERVSAAESLRGELAALKSAMADVLQERRVAARRD